MWQIIWLVIKGLFWLACIGCAYYIIFRTAILGRGLFFPDMRRVDEKLGLYESWHSVLGYVGYYVLLLMWIVLPVAFGIILNIYAD